MIEIIDGLKQALPYLHTLLLAIFGGTVQYFREAKESKRHFKWGEFLADILASAFAGTLTYFLCKVAGIDGYEAMILVAISGNMGVKAIDLLQHFYTKLLPKM